MTNEQEGKRSVTPILNRRDILAAIRAAEKRVMAAQFAEMEDRELIRVLKNELLPRYPPAKRKKRS